MKTKIPDAVLAAEVSRRGLVKTTAIGGLAMASSALTLPLVGLRTLSIAPFQQNQTKRLSGAPVQLTVVVAAATYARRGR
ncbi:tat (twin-arginine translocation) pathway signal sequence domain protein [Escherichia coli]|nr:tat (twin-arginine translocation) pathway signal sequence domain protein [Escherichia coli]